MTGSDAVQVTQANLRVLLPGLGFGSEDVERIVASVCKVGDSIAIEAPERVHAYIDAVIAGDDERAELIAHAREG